jgi:hypothetical protein
VSCQLYAPWEKRSRCPLNRSFGELQSRSERFIIILLTFTTHLRVLASSVLRFRDHTQGRTTAGRTPLDEWSARSRGLYLTNTQHSQQTNIYAPGGIRTRNPSRRAAADPRLIPLGQWDRPVRTFRRTETNEPKRNHPTVSNITPIQNRLFNRRTNTRHQVTVWVQEYHWY